MKTYRPVGDYAFIGGCWTPTGAGSARSRWTRTSRSRAATWTTAWCWTAACAWSSCLAAPSSGRAQRQHHQGQPVGVGAAPAIAGMALVGFAIAAYLTLFQLGVLD